MCVTSVRSAVVRRARLWPHGKADCVGRGRIEGHMRPVRKNRNYRVLSGTKPLEQELGLTPPKMQDTGDPRGDRVAQRRLITIDE